MSLMLLKKKRYKFQVDLTLDELTEVSYAKGTLFAKVRQIDGGSFCDVSKRKEVVNHRVEYAARFVFPCRMLAAASSGVLETCKCRISMRMEEKGGRHFRKLGFADVNLSEYAGAGPTTQRYILQAYDRSHRLDNSIVKITVNVTLREGDTIFQRPLTRQQPIATEEDASFSLAAASRGLQHQEPGSLNPSQFPPAAAGENPPSLASSSSNPPSLTAFQPKLSDDASHSRNSSSSTSAGYSSSQNSHLLQQQLLQQQQGSDHHPPPLASGGTTVLTHSRKSSSETTSSHGRNLSQSSCDTGYYGGGSMEKKGRGSKASASGASGDSASSRLGKGAGGGGGGGLEDGRVDAEAIIDELMAQADIGKEESGEVVGLQLYLRKDGTVTFDQSSNTKDAKPVVMVPPR